MEDFTISAESLLDNVSRRGDYHFYMGTLKGDEYLSDWYIDKQFGQDESGAIFSDDSYEAIRQGIRREMKIFGVTDPGVERLAFIICQRYSHIQIRKEIKEILLLIRFHFSSLLDGK